MVDEDNLEAAEEMDNSHVEPIEESEAEEPSEEVQDDSTYEEESEEVPEKFKEIESLAKSYKSLEQKLSQLGEDNARLKEENARANMSPEDRETAEQNSQFIKSNDLMTKAEFMQMQKDQRESESLLKAGATDHQIDRVKRVSRYADYSKMSITEIYRDLYGFVPKNKPKQGATQKPRGKSIKSKGYTAAQVQAMSPEEYKEKRADIIAQGIHG